MALRNHKSRLRNAEKVQNVPYDGAHSRRDDSDRGPFLDDLRKEQEAKATKARNESAKKPAKKTAKKAAKKTAAKKKA